MLALGTPIDWILLGVLAVVLLMLASIRTTVRRLEVKFDKMQQVADNQPNRTPKSEDPNARDSAFEQFLAEDPARISMPKSEQFAAYRQWRKDKGMNWSG